MSFSDEDVLEDEGAGYLVSVSDIMAGLLFVFIITLMAFVIKFENAKAEQTKTVEQLTNNQTVRKQLLEELKKSIEARSDVQIKIDADTGVLLLDEDAVPFASSKSKPRAQGRRNLKTIADALEAVIPCYSHTPPLGKNCSPEHKNKLEAIFIEGHTDNQPVRRRNYSNWNLSSDRAINSYQIMMGQRPALAKLENSTSQPLFSVSGYADQRPLKDPHGEPFENARQRRIELRFIMTPPQSPDSPPADVDPVSDLKAQGLN